MSNVERIIFSLADDAVSKFEATSALPADVVAAVRASGWAQVSVDLTRQYKQVRYEAFPSCVGHTYYGLEEQNQQVNAHRLRVQAALATCLVTQDAPS